MPTWIQIGEHRCYVEGNLFVMELCGPVAYSEIAGLLAPQAVQLVEHASRLLTGRPLDTTFVTTEQAAWHWIESRRTSDLDFSASEVDQPVPSR